MHVCMLYLKCLDSLVVIHAAKTKLYGMCGFFPILVISCHDNIETTFPSI